MNGIMWNRLALGAAGLALIGVALALAGPWPGARPAHALSNCATSTETTSPSEQTMLDLLNAYRAQNGAGALTMSPNLNRAAAFMAEDMTAKRYFSHYEPSGRTPFQRALDCGYPSSNVGENLAATGSSASATFGLFKTSPLHDENMLKPSWRAVGIAQHGSYWALVFGQTVDSGGSQPPQSASASPTATPTATPTPTPGPKDPSTHPIPRAMLQMLASE